MASNRSSSSVIVSGLYTSVSGYAPNNRKLMSNQSVVEISEYIGISRRHWVLKTSREVCKSRSCRAKFTLINSPKNCFKCGEVYCKQCLKQSRRLNLFANYDPQGKFYKVCKSCFDSEEQTAGATRSLMKEFRILRTASFMYQNKACSKNALTTAEQRLREGFLAEVNSTPNLVRMVQSLTITFVRGAWKKPVTPKGNDGVCHHCMQKFEMLFKSRHHCSICGAAVCDSCSNRDLIVYIDKGQLGDNSHYTEALVCLIRLPGGPSAEPDIHQYLRICTPCYEAKKTSQEQVERDIAAGVKQQEIESFWNDLLTFHDKLLTDQRLIVDSLEKYESLVKCLDDGTERTNRGNNVQILAKAQIDLNDLFYSYLMKTGKIKAFKPISSNSAVLISNMQKSAARFYSENKSLFSELKASLEEYLPIAIIETIQNQVNKTALICVHLLVKQLAFEVLSFSNKEFGEQALEIATQLADAEEVIADELKVVLGKLDGNETSWDAHEKDANAMIKESLKDHRLIRPTAYHHSRPEFLLNEVIERSCTVLDQIELQLNSKATQSSYTKVKDTIQQVKQSILEVICGSDWVMVK